MTRNEKVLVISDGPEQFALAASALGNEGYSVMFASDVKESLRIANAESPNMIISELAMSDIDGLQICRQFRKDKAMRTTPILLVGDLSESSPIVKDGRRCGASDYVQRPFTFDALARRVKEMLDPQSLYALN